MIKLPPPVCSDGSVLVDDQIPSPAATTPTSEPELEPAAAAPTEISAPAGSLGAHLPEPDDASADGGLPSPVAEFLRAQVSSQPAGGDERWLQATTQKLRVALRNYGFDADVLGERLTPNAALVRFRGSDKLTVADVEKKQSVLLTSHGIDVIGILPEKGEVVVMVAREERAILDLPALWLRREFPKTAPAENTCFLLGERESDGTLLYLNLSERCGGQPQHGPHTLIAGETGSGKGVLTRNLILDICATNSPANARIRVIDPKGGGDYPWIGTIPHLDGELVTSQDGAMEVLKTLVDEMENRYVAITKSASNIDRYNAKVRPDQRLPRIYLFHDEIGDWMIDKDRKDYREAVESYVERLGMKARAAGIHLFLITQRPDKDALPGPIKANMNNKLCLRVSSQLNSRIVLDENGGETLLGHGHLAAKLANERPSNQTNLIFAQTPLLDDDVAFDLAGVIRDYWNAR